MDLRSLNRCGKLRHIFLSIGNMQQTQQTDKLPSDLNLWIGSWGRIELQLLLWFSRSSLDHACLRTFMTQCQWLPCILGNSGSSLERDLMWMKLMNWFVWISFDLNFWFSFHWMRWSWDSCQLVYAIFLVIHWHPSPRPFTSDSTCNIQQADSDPDLPLTTTCWL